MSPLYKMSTPELEEVRKYLIKNLEKGYIILSDSPFASLVLFVKKKDGSLRFCVNYKRLNTISKKDRYPLPLIEETLARISKAKIFTKIDIRQAFHRIRMDPNSEMLTTFRTRYGSYKYRVLPFGLSNGPSTYQRYMNDVLFDYLDVFCTAYLDDILIYSDNELEHQEHVRKVLQRLREAGLQADIKKCEFAVKRTKFLGFIITTDGIEVDPEKIEAIRSWKEPTTVKGIQAYLGFCNFYRIFIREYSRIARPLTQLTRKDQRFKFTEEYQETFNKLKQALCSAPILTHYHLNRETRMETDSSDIVTVGVLSQKGPNGEWHLVAFYSKTISPVEYSYEIYDKELLANMNGL